MLKPILSPQAVVCTIISLLISTTLFSQTAWDINYGGLKVKKETIISYTDNESNVADSTIISYYADGKLKEYYTTIWIKPPEGDGFWNTSSFVHHYRGDSLWMLHTMSKDEIVQVGIGNTWHNAIKHNKTTYYFTEIDALCNKDPQGAYLAGYNKKGQIINSEWRSFEGSYFANSTYEYKGLDMIKQIDNTTFDGNKETNERTFKILDKDKNGWTKRSVINTDSKLTQVRTLDLYEDKDLSNSDLLYKGYQPQYSLEDVMKAFRGDYYSTSTEITPERLKVLDLGILLIESNPEILEDTYYDPLFFYEKKASYYIEQEQNEMALETLKGGLNAITNEEKINKLNCMVAYVYYDNRQYQEALDYYKKVKKNDYNAYDPMGNFHSLTLIEYNFFGGETATADSLMSPVVSDVESIIDNPDFTIEAMNYDGANYLRKIAALQEKLENYSSAEKFLTIIKDFWEYSNGKDSDDYLNAVQELIRVKKLIIQQN